MECGSYCPSIPEHLPDDIISASFFDKDGSNGKLSTSANNFAAVKGVDLLHGSAEGKYSVSESKLCYGPGSPLTDHMTCSRPSTGGSGAAARLPESLFCSPEMRECSHSNESGVHSATPPSSSDMSTVLLHKNNNEGSPSWVSSDDSLFKKPLSTAGSSVRDTNSRSDKLRQVRFQKCHDSFV